MEEVPTIRPHLIGKNRRPKIDPKSYFWSDTEVFIENRMISFSSKRRIRSDPRKPIPSFQGIDRPPEMKDNIIYTLCLYVNPYFIPRLSPKHWRLKRCWGTNVTLTSSMNKPNQTKSCRRYLKHSRDVSVKGCVLIPSYPSETRLYNLFRYCENWNRNWTTDLDLDLGIIMFTFLGQVRRC